MAFSRECKESAKKLTAMGAPTTFVETKIMAGMNSVGETNRTVGVFECGMESGSGSEFRNKPRFLILSQLKGVNFIECWDPEQPDKVFFSVDEKHARAFNDSLTTITLPSIENLPPSMQINCLVTHEALDYFPPGLLPICRDYLESSTDNPDLSYRREEIDKLKYVLTENIFRLQTAPSLLDHSWLPSSISELDSNLRTFDDQYQCGGPFDSKTIQTPIVIKVSNGHVLCDQRLIKERSLPFFSGGLHLPYNYKKIGAKGKALSISPPVHFVRCLIEARLTVFERFLTELEKKLEPLIAHLPPLVINPIAIRGRRRRTGRTGELEHHASSASSFSVSTSDVFTSSSDVGIAPTFFSSSSSAPSSSSSSSAAMAISSSKSVTESKTTPSTP